jgi:uncharacterized membrane protein (DUF485 family)
MNDHKTKFLFKQGKRPFCLIWRSKFRIPISIIKGLLGYLLFAVPASYTMTWLLRKNVSNLALVDICFWAIDVFVWLMALIHLLEGMKYQSSENEIMRDLSDKFELI